MKILQCFNNGYRHTGECWLSICLGYAQCGLLERWHNRVGGSELEAMLLASMVFVVQWSRNSSKSQWSNGKVPGASLWLTWGASGWLSKLAKRGWSCEMLQRHPSEKPRAVGPVNHQWPPVLVAEEAGYAKAGTNPSSWVPRSHICPLFSQTPWEREGWEMRRGSGWWPNLKDWGSKGIS